MWGLDVLPLFELSKSDVDKMETKCDVKGLVKALAYKDKDVRRAAAQALRIMGRKGLVVGNAYDGLVVALKDPDWVVRRVAASALGEIGDARAIDELVIAIKDQYAVGWMAAKVLGEDWRCTRNR